MSRKDGVLCVVLTGKWFDMIESGEKMEEYRGSNWERKLWSDVYRSRCPYDNVDGVDEFHPYHTLVASRGYTSRTLTRKIKHIRWGKPRPEWSGDTVTGECFIIELEAPE